MAGQGRFGPEAFQAETSVSRETLDRLVVLEACLRDWQGRINLLGPSELEHLWRRHILDSWQLAALMPKTGKVLDLGSGSGFPALVLGIISPGLHITMVESVGKKCAFLRDAVENLGLSARVIQGRVEAQAAFSVDVVTARAFAPMPKLLEYSAPWLIGGVLGVFPKGRRWQEELTQAQESWRFTQEVIPSRTSDDGVIVIVSEVSRGEHPDAHPGRSQSKRRRR